MSIKELSFQSYNERDTIKAWLYTPTAQPRGVVQVVHGFGEHSRRYMHLIMKLLDEGFVVCADDHVGHGKTAADAGTWGDYGFKGYATTTEDEKTLHDIVAKEFADLPYIMFGHSWGSMIARDYASKYGDELAALILCGTVGLLEHVAPLKEKLGKLNAEGKGAEVHAELLDILFTDFNKRNIDAKTPNDWIATDPCVVADHASDPFNNFTNAPNVQALYDFTDLWINISSEEWAAKLPVNLPVYLIAGDQDPVGYYGEGVYKVSNWLWATGKKKVKTVIYSGYRHEVHNEPDIRNEVETGIIRFIHDII